MLRDSVMVRCSENAEIEVYDERDKFIASKRNGEWHNKLLFNDFELEEFKILEDDTEIARVLAEARAALNLPFSDSANNLARSN